VRLTPGAEAALPLLVAGFLVAACLALVLTPIVRSLALRAGMVDEPDRRRVNVRPVPRAGGVATVSAFVAVGAAAVWINGELDLVPLPAIVGGPELIALLAGSIAAALIGLIDDYLQVRARWQLVGQFGLAAWAIALGIGVTSINNPLGPGAIRLEGPLMVAFTLFWIVGMINAINFIDGLDGLSSGIGLIAAVTLGLISLTTTVGQPFIAILCFVLAGSLLGFLRWNFHPATIFAGTSGTMFLGFALAVLAVLGTAKVAVALLVLGVPIIDAFWIIVRRLMTGRTPFSPDRGHIHHRLLDLGLTHTQVVLFIYGICIAFGALSLLLSGTGQVYAFLGLFLLGGLGVFVLARRSVVAEGLQARTYAIREQAHEDRSHPPAPSDRPGQRAEEPRDRATS
jgi:UDP-GlcNAc:undecaprenyl-phosphate GlcNAc-1-phosphate transferase